MTLIQNYLKTHSFRELIADHGVYASLSKNKRKISLNYDQIDTKNDDVLALDCRGIILAKSNFDEFEIDINNKLDLDVIIGDTQIVAFGMRRFFNYGQGEATIINWEDPNTVFLEKLDGTLTILYYDLFTREWCVATRSCPDADIPLDGAIFTFRTLFEKALKDTVGVEFDEFTNKLYRSFTYCFELTSPYNRIVVNYKETRITLIATRDLTTLEEVCIDDVNTYDVPHVKAYELKSLNDVLEWVAAQNPLEHEGLVVRCGTKRIKVKNPSYVAFNRARDILGASERNCLELVLAGKEDDVSPALPPEIVERIVKIKYSVTAMFKDYDRTYNLLKYAADQINSGDKKTFAMMVNGYKDIWTAPMFSIYSGIMIYMKDFIAKNRNEGTWSNSFLDKVLMIIKNY